jgi:hypothetical protein
MGLYADLWGTVKAAFQIGIGGVKLKNAAANLEVKAADGTTDAAITVSKVNISGDVLDINSDAAGAAADWKYTVQRPAAGMTQAVTLTLPPTDGSPGQVLQTDGSGVLTFEDASSTASSAKFDTTSLAFGSSSPVTMFTLPANAIVHAVQVIIDTPFNGTAPTMSVGVAGTTSKFMGTGDVNLKGTAKDVYTVHPGEPADGSPENLILTYAADGSAAGAARVLVTYSVPA